MAGKSMELGGGGRFAAVARSAAAGGARNPAAVAAAAGRAKYGARGMAALSHKGTRGASFARAEALRMKRGGGMSMMGGGM